MDKKKSTTFILNFFVLSKLACKGGFWDNFGHTDIWPICIWRYSDKGTYLGCIHLLNTRKYCDNTRNYCGKLASIEPILAKCVHLLV